MPKTTIPPLDSLSLKELVELHNAHAETPVKRFRDKPTAIARVTAVLPRDSCCKPEQPQSLPDRLLAIMRDGNRHHVDALALALDCATAQVRGALGGLRHRGYETLNVAPSTFALGRFEQGGRAKAGPRYTQEG